MKQSEIAEKNVRDQGDGQHADSLNVPTLTRDGTSQIEGAGRSKALQFSKRGSNPRPWAHKTHALTN